ncbi:hypothetical protein [Frankia sp. EAN1pec]|uniref:hypothetical protein n=1 Tax=Parafrankia sp. (strain EAN1pec) TaxID=298653 RepID=UPI0002F060EF
MTTRPTTSLYIDPADRTPRFEAATLPDLPPQVVLPGEVRISALLSTEDAAAAGWFRALAAAAEQVADWHTARAGGAL